MDGEAATQWQLVHERLVDLARVRAGLDFDEGVQLLAAHRERVHERLGYGGFVEYIERLFGYSPRLTYEKLRVAEALERLPQLAVRLRDGKLTWSAVRELTRVATAETEHDWIAAASGTTARETERLVSGHHLGDRPGDPVDDALRRYVLRFDVSGEVLATFREALAKIRRDAAGPLDDDAALLLLARHVLGGGVARPMVDPAIKWQSTSANAATRLRSRPVPIACTSGTTSRRWLSVTVKWCPVPTWALPSNVPVGAFHLRCVGGCCAGMAIVVASRDVGTARSSTCITSTGGSTGATTIRTISSLYAVLIIERYTVAR